MSYNLKCCSFYPNNFDASALTRPRYACTPTEVHTNPDRGTHVSRPRYAHFTTEMSIHHDQDEHTRRPKCGDQAAPTTYYSPIKKAQLSSKLCLFLWRRGKKRGGGEGSEGLAHSGKKPLSR